LPPFGTKWSGPTSTTAPESSGKPRTSTSDNEPADLLWREIDDRGDLPTDQRFATVVLSELRRGAFHADLRSEIDRQFERGAARLGKRLGRDNRADANVDPGEIVVGDRHGVT
jgi:hypothetical protein